jgi:hypothetical protein
MKQSVPAFDLIAAIKKVYLTSNVCSRVSVEAGKKNCFDRAIYIMRTSVIELEKEGAVWDCKIFNNVLDKLNKWRKIDNRAKIQSLTEFSKGSLEYNAPRVS